jgi:2-dehydro-3-deoxygluconokinase
MWKQKWKQKNRPHASENQEVMMEGIELITVGETMVLFDPVERGSLRHAHLFKKRIAGAESNVAIGVSRLGHKAGWISQVSDDEMGDFLINSIRAEGVDTTRVTRTSMAPTGILVKERVRESETQVYYYRHGSAASLLTKGQMDWDYINQAKILHISGITPFLSDSCYEVTKSLIEYGRSNQIFISFDPNLRMKLINQVPNPKEMLIDIAKGVDLFMPGIDEAAYLFDTRNPEEIFDRCFELGVKQIVLKDGERGTYYANHDDRGFVESTKVKQVVDPVGAGDGFAAGVLSALLEGMTLENAVERGSVIGAIVVSTEGDIEGLPTKRQLERFLHKNQDVIR